MFDHDSAFFQRSQAIASKFLQTTVIIDDQVKYRAATAQAPVLTATQIQAEAEQPSSPDEVTTRSTRGSSEPLVAPENERKGYRHDLYADDIINGFARKKIVCSVINPTLASDLTNTFKDLAVTADIIVVDWDLKLEEDDGETALDILGYISESAIETPSQLRLFAIYTGDPNVGRIAEKIKTTLETKYKADIKRENGSDLVLTLKAFRIVVFAKPDAKIAEQYENYQVPFDNLPDRLIIEFTKMTAGLVSNVALEALTCLRENTFRILGRFARELDAPYLTHRLLQPNPSDAEDHLVSILSEEFYAILDEAKVGEKAGIDAIEDWLALRDLKSFNPAKKSSDTKKQKKTYNSEDLLNLFENGSEKLDTDLGRYSTKSVYDCTTEQLAMSPEAAGGLDEKFAMLTSLRSFYETTARVLSMGTIVQKQKPDSDPQYLLCLQPVCDSVRLSSVRNFPFIPLTTVTKDKKFSIVIFESLSSSFVYLVPSAKAYDLELIKFKPDEGEDKICTHIVDSTYVFIDQDNNSYKWIAELRSEHAMRLVHNFTSNMSRIGLNESEWLRLSSS